MSRTWYGSLTNRLDENRMFTDRIETGTLATVYHYSDRTAYEVVKVDNEKHIFIRRLKANRVDENGMSDAQEYEYSSCDDYLVEELKFKRGSWVRVTTINIADEELCESESEKHMMRFHRRVKMTEKQLDKYEQGKDVEVNAGKVNISFGYADEYYDYSF